MEKSIRFQGMEDVQAFIALTASIPEKMELCADGVRADAKSMMGVFCFDLKKAVRLRVYADDTRAEEIFRKLDAYIID